MIKVSMDDKDYLVQDIEDAIHLFEIAPRMTRINSVFVPSTHPLHDTEEVFVAIPAGFPARIEYVNKLVRVFESWEKAKEYLKETDVKEEDSDGPA